MQKIITTLFLSLLLVLSACSAQVDTAEAPYVEDAQIVYAPRTTSAPPSQPEYGYDEPIVGGGALEMPAGSPEQPSSTPIVATPRSTPLNIDDISRQLSWASFGYSVPKKANINEEIEVRMLINPLVSEEDIEEELGSGTRATGRVQIARVIEAKLTSRDFEIQNITPDRQVVMTDRNTEWLWSLKPYTAGPDKKIKITVNAIVIVDGERTERYIETYTDTISVDITMGQQLSQWMSSNWEWAWSALLIPLLGYAWSRRKTRAKDEES